MKTNTPPNIIAFASSKGGAGKSTSCINIAGGLAMLGHQVHIVDCDPSQTVWRWFSSNPAARELPGVSCEELPKDNIKEFIKQLLTERSGYVLMDLPGHLSTDLLRVTLLASLVITPAKLSEPDIIEANKLYETLLLLGKNYGKTVVQRILLNEVPHAVGEHQIAMMKQLEHSTLPRFKTIIHQRAAYGKSFTSGVPPHFSVDRQITTKAVPELNLLLNEITHCLSHQSQKEAA